MRLRWMVVGIAWNLAVAQTTPGGATRGQLIGHLTLSDCRLEHPLRLNSVAARCGVLKVPLNRAASAIPAVAGATATVTAAASARATPVAALTPATSTLDLKVAVVPALNRRAAATPLFLLAGGPGQSAVDMYTALAGAFARINRDHDIVLVDQRGTGKSSPLYCDYPDDWQRPADAMPALREATLACLKKYGPDVRHYTTGAAVLDLDDVRAALGYQRLSLYASSYGTRVAQLYMRRLGAHVEAAILDGVTYPEQVIGPDTPLDGEEALQKILSRCLGDKNCATAYPNLREELSTLRRRFGPETVALTLADPVGGTPTLVNFNKAMLGAALRFLSYSGAGASILPTLIHEAAAGDYAPLAAQTIMTALKLSEQIASGMQNTVICGEDVPFLTKTYQGNEQLDDLREICKLWPADKADADLHLALTSSIPTLLLSGEADPVTPPKYAEAAARGLTRHRHLVLQGEGHGQLATSCMPRLMAEFLKTPDPDRLDAGCLKVHRPADFFVRSTGPAP